MDTIEKAKNKFIKMVKNNDSDPFTLLPHIDEMEKWAKYVLKKNPTLDSEVIMFSVFLHDIGHYPINKEIDHAVSGEKIAKKLLQEWKIPQQKMSNILHCIRAHRCKDVPPETAEAKIIACIDSASHLTSTMYLDIIKNGRADYAIAKLDRDFRDLTPEIKDKLKDTYHSWKALLENYKKLNLED